MSAIGDMACDILLGDSSPCICGSMTGGLINTSFGGAFEMMPGVAYLYAGGDSRDARTVAGEIYREAERGGGGHRRGTFISRCAGPLSASSCGV